MASNKIERIVDAVTGTAYKLSSSSSAGKVYLGGITLIAFSNDNSIFAVGYGDGSVRLWSSKNVTLNTEILSAASEDDPAEGQQNHALLGSNQNKFIMFKPIVGLNFTADNKKIVICRAQEIKVIAITNFSNKKSTKNLNETEGNKNWSLPDFEMIVAASFSLANCRILVVSESFKDFDHLTCKYRIYDLMGRQIGNTQVLRQAEAVSAAWSPNGEYAIIGLSNASTCLISNDCRQLITSKVDLSNQSPTINRIVGAINHITWTDQLMIGTGNSNIFVVSIFGTTIAYEDYLFTQTSANLILAKKSGMDYNLADKLQTKEAIVHFQIENRKVLALTQNFVYCWSFEKMNTPTSFQIPNGFTSSNSSGGGSSSGGVGGGENGHINSASNLDNLKILMKNSYFCLYNLEQNVNFEYSGRKLSQNRFTGVPILVAGSENRIFYLTKNGSLENFEVFSLGGGQSSQKSLNLKEIPVKLAIFGVGNLGFWGLYFKNHGHL